MTHTSLLLFFSSTKDWWDRASVIATILLVIVGAVTFVAVWMQARQSTKATRAMENSVAAFIKSQLPQFRLSAAGNPTQELMDLQTPRVTMKLVNVGLTTAYDCTYESWMEVLPFPFGDFTENADYFSEMTNRFALPPKGETIVNLPIRTGLTQLERLELRKSHRFACIRIRLEFTDGFSAERRYASFGVYPTAIGIGYLPKYNDAN